MKTSVSKTESLFFAYQGSREGHCDNNVDAIKRAITDFNSHQKTINAVTWEDLKKSGSFIDKEILQHIKQCSYFACDLTYLNHNVLFELGYAIALNKNIFIFLNEDIEQAKSNYLNFFLKNIKYTPFKNSKEILSKLQNKEFSNEHIKNAIPNDILNEENDIFYLENDSESQATIDLNEYINGLSTGELKLKVKLNDPYEVDYKTLSYYFLNLHKAKTIIFHMLPTNYDNAFFENGKNSFLAGIACGLNKQVLLIAPAKFRSPLDYSDILIDYISSEDCINKIHQWIQKHCKNNFVENSLEDKNQNKSEINILKIALECTAENEKEDLFNYFVSTSAYEKAKENKSKLLLVGRKGAGKTAIYYKLIEDLSSNSKNYNINLKPDSLELLENIDFSALYKSESSKKTFFYTVWKTVIYSKLIQNLKIRITEKLTLCKILTNEENKILDFCANNENLVKQNFFGIIKELSTKLSEHTIESPRILEDLYRNYLTPLTILLKQYFENKKYIKLNILSDNLDKSWNPQSNLDLQSSMILTLLEVDSQIKNELSNDKKDNITVLNYIFLREDIYNYIAKEANEPDKLRTISFKINWEDSPLKLKELVELKLNHILGWDNQENNSKDIWKELFEQIEKHHSTFDLIKNIIILRPRDIIFFIQALFESSANNNRNKVTKEDFEYAVNQYTEFLNGNLIAEMKAEYRDIQEILNIFQLYKSIKYKDYISKLKTKFNYNEDYIKKLTEALFKNNYLMAIDKTSKKFCINYKELETALTKKRFFIFKHNVFLFVNSQYLTLTNKTAIKKMLGI